MSYHPMVEQLHQPMYATSVRGVGPVTLGTTGTTEDRFLTALVVMGGAGLLLLALTHKSRGPGFLTFNPCQNC